MAALTSRLALGTTAISPPLTTPTVSSKEGTVLAEPASPVRSESPSSLTARTSPLVAKQLSYLKKHQEQIRQFLREVCDASTLPSTLREKAGSLVSLFQRIIEGPVEESLVLTCADSLLQLHSDCINVEENRLCTPLFLKRFDRLDRLSGERKPSLFAKIRELILSTAVLLNKPCVEPTRSETASATYFVREAERGSKCLMLFKPTEGEPSGFPGLEPGGGFKRQIAAYLIDRQSGGQARVPLSALARVSTGSEMGSLQVFRKSEGSLQALPLASRLKISPQELQKAALFRLRFFEQDAHLGNFLWRSSGDELVIIPIDFDACLPAITDETTSRRCAIKMAMRFFPQMDLPLTDENRNYILALDVKKDAAILEELGFSPSEITLFIATTVAMQKMAKLGHTAGEIMDFLDSEAFKMMIPSLEATEVEALQEEISAYLDKSLKGHIATLMGAKELSEKALALLARPPSEADEFHPADTAFYLFKQAFEESGGSIREALKIARAIIRTYPDRKEAEAVVTYLQDAFAYQPRAIYDAISACADAFEEAGRKPQMEKIRAWLSKLV